MTYDVEERLAVALRTRAEAPVDADALLAGALVAGRARARRHRLVTVGGAGVAGMTAAALVAVPLALAPADGGNGGNGSGPDFGFVGDMPALPAAQGESAAAQRPDQVGADPTVLRFGLDEAPLPVQGVEWGSVGGVEHMRVHMVDGRWGVSAVVELVHGTLPPSDWDDPTTANTEQEVRVDGRPAVLEDDGLAPGHLPRRWVHWRPADGLEMRISLIVDSYYSDSKDAAAPVPSWNGDSVAAVPAFLVDLAESVRLDTTTRCGAPMRLTEVPDDARLAGCVAGGGASPDTTIMPGWAKLTLRGPTGTLEADAYAFPRDPIPTASYLREEPTGSPLETFSSPAGGGPTETPGPGAGGSPPPTGVAQFVHAGAAGAVTATGGYGQRDAERVAAGVRQVGDPAEPSTWPLTPVG